VLVAGDTGAPRAWIKPPPLVPGRRFWNGYPDAAFRGLYAEYRPAVLRLATALTGGDRGRAEDLSVSCSQWASRQAGPC
jgi:hypothetical protein